MGVIVAFPDILGRPHEAPIFNAQLTWIGTTPVIMAGDEQAELAAKWRASAIESAKLIGRREYVAEQRDQGIEPTRRKGGKRLSGLCSYCLRHSPDLERDHIVPFSQGGDDSPDNLTLACRTCNAKKKDKSLLAFVATGGGVA